MFKLKIIYYLMKMYDISLGHANSIWEEGFDFDDRIYKIMNLIIDREHPKVLINRNPTLNYYSMLLMRIRRIKPDRDCYTLSIPLSILPGLNADLTEDVKVRSAVMYIRALCERLTSGVVYNVYC